MAGLPKIQAGYRVGKLNVISRTSQRKNGYIVWLCQCDCGGKLLLDTRCLQRGTIRDCGCATAVRPGQKDLSGMRFGRLICLEPTQQRGPSGGTVWRCQCDCGNECLAVSTQLTKGYKKSCGCLKHSRLKDLAAAVEGKPWQNRTKGCDRDNPSIRDLVGLRFGRLIVLEQTDSKNGKNYWRCRCDCGKETTVRDANLISGHTQSCGCLQREQILDNLRLVDGTSITILEATKGRLIASNTSGYNGVYWNRKSRKWVAQITFQGKTHYLGSYDQIEEAIKARRRKEEMYDEFLQRYYAEHPEHRKEGD